MHKLARLKVSSWMIHRKWSNHDIQTDTSSIDDVQGTKRVNLDKSMAEA